MAPLSAVHLEASFREYGGGYDVDDIPGRAYCSNCAFVSRQSDELVLKLDNKCAQLSAARAQIEDMHAELLRLRAQLAAGVAPRAVPTEEGPSAPPEQDAAAAPEESVHLQ